MSSPQEMPQRKTRPGPRSPARRGSSAASDPRQVATAGQLDADLVLEGGGVKGIAHIGALGILEEAGYRFHRVAGTSAGSIAAAFAAGCAAGGTSIKSIEPLMTPGATADSIDYRKVPQGKTVPVIEQGRELIWLLLEKGAFSGDYLREWVRSTLKKQTGVEYFRDLKLDDQRKDLQPSQRYSLVVMVSDLSRGSLVRLPWDYPIYGLDPDKQLVADAIRASTSIPFFFKPVRLPWGPPSRNRSYMVDGGALSDFPIEIFDRTDGQAPRWPTFGIKLQAALQPGDLQNEVGDTFSFAEALLETIISGNDQVHLADPCVVQRTMFVDTSFVSSVNFDLSPAEQQRLFAAGQQAARDFLADWDWADYQSRCAVDAARIAKARAARGDVQGARDVARRAKASKP